MDKIEIEQLKNKMQKTVDALDKELSGLKTGKASIKLVDSLMVEIYGRKMPISQVSTITTPDIRTLMLQVWDKDNVKAVEKAIVEANIGLNPNHDGQLIRISIPLPSEYRRKELVKIAHKYGENSKITLRGIRRDMIDLLKQREKKHDISQDEQHVSADKIQKITNDFSKIIDDHISDKEKEILNI